MIQEVMLPMYKATCDTCQKGYQTDLDESPVHFEEVGNLIEEMQNEGWLVETGSGLCYCSKCHILKLQIA